MPHRPHPAAPRARDHPEDTIVRLLALALAALTITTIPRTWLADLLAAAAWLTLLASLLFTGLLLLTRRARTPQRSSPRERRSAPASSDQRRDEQRDNEQSLDRTSFDSTR